jgi:DNA mismatch repair protein MutL
VPAMREKIQMLSPEVVDQIAAGEVVERPASAVKELIENALDAGAGEIQVKAAGGGVTLMEVADDGCGMDAEEVLDAVRRHTTSKIRRIEDLGGLQTFGFRGEALSAISAVSRLELISRRASATEGSRLRLQAGRVVEQGPWGCPSGTRIRVEDLFFNVPARRKFLRTAVTEARHLKEVVERVALMHPHIGFYYEYEGRCLINCSTTSDWSERIRRIWGPEVAEQLFHVQHRSNGLEIQGFLSHPNLHRSTANALWFYVNGRAVQDRGLLYAVIRGYGPLLDKGRYPLGLLNIRLDPAAVDVNVHPTKREVRFKDQQRVYDGAVVLVRRLMREQPWATGLDELRRPRREERAGGSEARADVAEPLLPYRPTASTPLPEEGGPIYGEDDSEAAVRFLGQVDETYLVFSGPAGLLIVDQHAAHERLLFDRLQEQWRNRECGESQRLLWSEVVDLPPHHAELLERLQETLSGLGWEIEHFGGDTWRIRSLPSWMNPSGVGGILLDLLDSYAESGTAGIDEDMIHRVLAQLACRRAVMSGRRLGATEAVHLLEQMRRAPGASLCPHGRPTVVEISLTEIRRRFARG